VDVRTEPLFFGMGAIADGVTGTPDSPFPEDGHEFLVADPDSEGFPVERFLQLSPHLLT
jgi:hypothetical protein